MLKICAKRNMKEPTQSYLSAKRPLVGRLGKEIIVFAMHGNNWPMTNEWPQKYIEVWDLVAGLSREYEPHFFMGDFNMAMLRVPRELSCRGLECDVLAYYPWAFRGHDPNHIHSHRLGLDSCCIFYVKGGDVEARVNWSASHIQRLLDAGRCVGPVISDWGITLHSYDDITHVPRKPW